MKKFAAVFALTVLTPACATPIAPSPVESSVPVRTESPAETPAPVAAIPETIAPQPVALRMSARVIDRLPDDFPHGGRARDAKDIDLIVIHTIGGAECRAGNIVFTRAEGSSVFWRDWFVDQNDKSIHYVIGRDGAIAQQRPDLRTGGHVSFHGVIERVNDRSIGIELVNRGDGVDPFPDTQIDAVKALVTDLSGRYAISAERLVTHEALDPRLQPDCGGQRLRRNVDPGPLFPLENVRAAMAPVK